MAHPKQICTLTGEVGISVNVLVSERILVTLARGFYALSSYNVLGQKKPPSHSYNNLNKIFIILLIDLLNTICCSVLSPAKTSVFLASWCLAQ